MYFYYITEVIYYITEVIYYIAEVMSQEMPSSEKKDGVEKVPRYFMPFSKARGRVNVQVLTSHLSVIEPSIPTI